MKEQVTKETQAPKEDISEDNSKQPALNLTHTQCSTPHKRAYKEVSQRHLLPPCVLIYKPIDLWTMHSKGGSRLQPPMGHPAPFQPNHSISILNYHIPHTLKYTQGSPHWIWQQWIHRGFLQEAYKTAPWKEIWLAAKSQTIENCLLWPTRKLVDTWTHQRLEGGP